MPLTLNLPYRGAGATQTAATLIEFQASAIDPAATVSVAGVVLPVPASSCVGNACSSANQTADGDDILLTRIAGTDRVRLSLTFFGSFAGGNLCGAPTIGVAGRSFSIELTGFTLSGPDDGYRITSLMPPSDSSCDIPYVRVPSARPTLSVTPPDTLTRLGRFPLSIVLVLDKSGSMGWAMPADPGTVRWDRLQDSVEVFANTWGVLGFAGADDGHVEDRVGVVFFDSTSVAHELGGPGAFFVERGAAADPWTGGINAAMAATSPGGSTSIGAGIETARHNLNTVAALTGDTAIVLFTDGEQNRSPCILHVGETPSSATGCSVAAGAGAAAPLVLNGSTLYPPSPDPPILARDVFPRGSIFTIGLGEGVMLAPGELLDEIAVETAGTNWLANNAAAMNTSFDESLVNFLQGGTVSRLAQTTGSLPASAAGTAPMEVAIDPSLTRVVFVAGWEQIDAEIDLELRQPDGTVVQPLQVERGRRSLVARIDLPASGPDGTWQVRLITESAVLTAGVPGSIDYRLTAYGVESRLSFRVTESARVGTDGPLRIIAEVGWDDAGLAELPAGALRAVIERPGENLGNILHDNETAAIDPRADQSAVAAKIAALIGSADLLERIEPRPVAESVLLQGVGHGRYEGSFAGVEVGGQYRIRVDFDWDDPRTGPIHREQIAERQAAVVPTAEDTTVEVGQFGGSRGTSVLITPRDGFGNYVGPGYAGHFAVTIDGRSITQPLADPGLTGAYLLDLSGLSSGSDPRIEIRFRGKKLRDAPLSQVEAAPSATGGKRPWWFWLLIALALLLLWWVFLR